MQISVAGILEFSWSIEGSQRRKIPGLLLRAIHGARQKNITGMPISAQPADEADQIAFRHGGAARSRTGHAASNMEENCAAFVRHGRIRVVPDLDEPVIGEIVVPHFFLGEPPRRIFRIIDRDQLVVVGARRIINPGIGL